MMKVCRDERPLPDMADAGAYYWKSGRYKTYTLGWCEECHRWLHPAREYCHTCFSAARQRAASGKAVLRAYTVNYHKWLSGYSPPYIIAIVSPVEDVSIQVTTNILSIDPDRLFIGMHLEAHFEPQEDLWIPVFKEALEKEEISISKESPSKSEINLKEINFILPKEKYEDKVVFSGIGKSEIGRNLGRSQLSLTLDACRKAIYDAGLQSSDIDGVCAYPGVTGMAGFSSGGVRELAYSMNLTPVWHSGGHEFPGQTGPLVSAMMAISAGLCRHVLCFTAFSSSVLPSSGRERITGERRWSLPYGCVSPANWIAMYATRYMELYNADEKLLGKVAIAARKHAALNPDSLYREPLDMETYLESRKISSPFKLLDCDTPCDGAVAFVISGVGYADEMPVKPVYVESCGTAFNEVQSWDQGSIVYQPNVTSAARHLWSRTSMTPADIDVAELYDGFTFNAVCWLEALGFCGPGEADDFIGDGSRIVLGGELPLNTHGGHLNAGRSNGYGHLYEAILQLRGSAGDRQVSGALTAMTSCGGGIPAGALLLRSFK